MQTQVTSRTEFLESSSVFIDPATQRPELLFCCFEGAYLAVSMENKFLTVGLLQGLAILRFQIKSNKQTNLRGSLWILGFGTSVIEVPWSRASPLGRNSGFDLAFPISPGRGG
jgi:hypothetical protein